MRLFTNPTTFRFLLGNPIPFIPFPLIRGSKERGALPRLNSPFDIYWQPSPFIPLPCKGGGIGYIREAKPPFDSPL